MTAAAMILSFHPRVAGDINLRLPHKHRLPDDVAATARNARAIIVTQHVKEKHYATLAALGAPIFPDYSNRFGFEGKVGNIELFRAHHAPHPETSIYRSVADFKRRHFEKKSPLPDYPFVLKGDRGGGGWAVRLVKDRAGLEKHLAFLENDRLHPTRRFIAQSYVEHRGRDLRVVVMGDHTVSYWRCQNQTGEFRNNVGRGAVIRYDLAPHLMQRGIRCVRDFCRETKINLAAFDVLFDRRRPDPCPFLSEINFLFGRKGLGGSPRFHRLLNDAVAQWLKKRPQPLSG